MARWWTGRWWALPLAVLLVSGIGFVAVYWVGVLTIRGQVVENRALGASDFLDRPDGLLSFVSIGTIALSLGILVLIGLASGRYRGIVRATGVVVVSNALAQVLKYEVLSRPAYLDDSSANTLPSGHAVAYASVLLGLIIVVPVALRTVAAIGSAAVLGVVVVQLLAYGWHRASDVLAGILLVMGTAALSQLLYSDRGREPGPARGRPALRALMIVSVLLVVAIIAIGIVATVDRSIATTHVLLLSGQMLCVAGVSVASVITVLLQRSGTGVVVASGRLAGARR
ncbi:MAG: hypothetical protein JWM50_2595 [Microbacteriaceae bacterium]|jgi:membrane-associated phospholipid phosphatase|nr:hypothetical protein [Microbacteriaceae bacterium]